MKPTTGTTLGWVSGFGLAIGPLLVAGIVSTFLPDPESMFPVAYAVAFAGMAGWIIYGSIRIPRFRKGALLGSAITLAVAVAVRLLLSAVSPT